jgi:hypothetical protein
MLSRKVDECKPLIAGINALTVTDQRFEEMIAEAAELSGRGLYSFARFS